MAGASRQVSARNSPRSSRHRLVAAEQVLERRDVGAVGVAALLRLLELLRIAEQHEAPGRLRHREHVGQRHLPGLVDEQHVDRTGRCPARAHSQRCRRRTCDRAGGEALAHLRVARRSPRPVRVVARAPCDLVQAGAPTSLVLGGLRHTSSSRLRMTLWLTAVTPTLPACAPARRSCARRCRSCRAGRALDGEHRASRRVAMRRAASDARLAGAAARASRRRRSRGGACTAADRAPRDAPSGVERRVGHDSPRRSSAPPASARGRSSCRKHRRRDARRPCPRSSGCRPCAATRSIATTVPSVSPSGRGAPRRLGSDVDVLRRESDSDGWADRARCAPTCALDELEPGRAPRARRAAPRASRAGDSTPTTATFSSRRCHSSSWASSQRACCSAVRAAGSAGTPSSSAVDDRRAAALAARRAPRRRAVSWRSGRGTACPRRSSSGAQLLEPVAQRARRDAVVAVVGLDRRARRRRRSPPAAALERELRPRARRRRPRRRSPRARSRRTARAS